LWVGYHYRKLAEEAVQFFVQKLKAVVGTPATIAHILAGVAIAEAKPQAVVLFLSRISMAMGADHFLESIKAPIMST
jgi:succinate dehydrogenase hydrophobic anchor subunit